MKIGPGHKEIAEGRANEDGIDKSIGRLCVCVCVCVCVCERERERERERQRERERERERENSHQPQNERARQTHLLWYYKLRRSAFDDEVER